MLGLLYYGFLIYMLLTKWQYIRIKNIIAIDDMRIEVMACKRPSSLHSKKVGASIHYVGKHLG